MPTRVYLNLSMISVVVNNNFLSAKESAALNESGTQ